MSYDEASLAGGGDPSAEMYPGRRQFDELRPQDLRATPAWWFPGPDGHLSGPDAGTVLPLDAGAADADGGVEFPPGRYLLAARFTLADGSVVTGHLTFVPGDHGTLRDREPTLCTSDGQIPLWHGVVTLPEDHRRAYLASLGKTAEETFPLRWEAVVHPPGDLLAGEAAGFAVWRDGALTYLR